MAGSDTDNQDHDDELAAARWMLAVEAGLDPAQTDAFHAWLAARPERAELIAQQAMLHDLATQAASQKLAGRARAEGPRSLPKRRFLLGGMVAAGAAVLAAIVLVVNTAPPSGGPAPRNIGNFATATGEIRLVELADTSRLWLDAQTNVSTSIGLDHRDVTLASGRLFVDVAHDAERPFIVQAGHFKARALGTAFEAVAFADRTGISVAEGVVRLTTLDGKVVDLAAGEGAWVSDSGELTRVIAAKRNVGAWRERRMVISNRRLDVALAELSRYFERPMRVMDEQLAARRVTLSFSIADLAAEDAAQIIARAVGAEVTGNAPTGIVLTPETRSAN